MKNVTNINTRNPRVTTRNVDHTYNGGFEVYEDPADYIDIRDVIKGRVIA